MNFKTTRRALLWSSIINYGLVIVWFLLFVLKHDWLLQLWGRWFHLSTEQFDFLNFAGMMMFKIFILVFNLVPLITLLIVGRATNDGALVSSFSRKEK
jgi:hypothetical protein